jgi:hypothetical protein
MQQVLSSACWLSSFSSDWKKKFCCRSQFPFVANGKGVRGTVHTLSHLYQICEVCCATIQKQMWMLYFCCTASSTFSNSTVPNFLFPAMLLAGYAPTLLVLSTYQTPGMRVSGDEWDRAPITLEFTVYLEKQRRPHTSKIITNSGKSP